MSRAWRWTAAADGLAYRLLAPELIRVLKPGGPVRPGDSATTRVMRWNPSMRAAKAGDCRVVSDLGQRDRVVIGTVLGSERRRPQQKAARVNKTLGFGQVVR